MKRLLKLVILLLIAGGIVAGLGVVWYWRSSETDSNDYIREWFTAPQRRSELTTTGRVACDGALFIMPSEGFIGLLWADPARPYNALRRHTGIDIFGDGESGTVPNYAAYDGYLTRLPDWKSTVIIRHDDPLNPGETIWTYYTHMANDDGTQSYIVDDFPQGTGGQWVEQGTLLGYQGTYSGTGPPIGMHLHFSIVKPDEDNLFLNEAVLDNTIDPSPYLGLPLNIGEMPNRPIRCP
jgi:murein DD-endopeptidase MepM/ murein hydrolase activator NlpD